MVKQNKLELDWIIVEVLPAWKFKVKLKDMDTVILCYKSGKMKMSHISVIEWDRVKVEVSPYDVGQWRIVYRYNIWQASKVNENITKEWKPEDNDTKKEATKTTKKDNKRPAKKPFRR